jgi:hypothetical protein
MRKGGKMSDQNSGEYSLKEIKDDLRRNLNIFAGMIKNIGVILAMNFWMDYCEINKNSFPEEIFRDEDLRSELEKAIYEWTQKTLEDNIDDLKNKELDYKDIEKLINLLSLKWDVEEAIFQRVKDAAETEDDNLRLKTSVEVRAKRIIENSIKKLSIKKRD